MHRHQARDGLTLINGYLTLPAGKAAKNLPLVLNPHGGPWARDDWGFNPEVQFLASRGYAVLQVNYRGSTGYGRKFWEASFKQWGRKMNDDLTDGVLWSDTSSARASPIPRASPSWAALTAAMRRSLVSRSHPRSTPAAFDYVGVSNLLFTFMNTIPALLEADASTMMHEMVGDPEKDKALLTEASPVFHVEHIRAPLFVAQGAKDPRVNIDENPTSDGRGH